MAGQFFFVIVTTGIWTQGFVDILILEPCLQIFALVTSDIGSCLLTRPSWMEILLFYAACCLGCQVGITISSSFSLSWHSHTFLSRLSWNCNPPDLSLPWSLGWQAHANTCWEGILWTILPGLPLNLFAQ
jgi:hypothetical protein